MPYPYQIDFVRFLRHQQLASATITSYNQSLSEFFSFLTTTNTGFADHPTVNNIFDRDIEAYLTWLTDQQQAKATTINKILSQINRYFQFLFTHHLTTQLPTISIHGPKRDSQAPFQTKWLATLPIILDDAHVHHYTRLTLLLLSKGYTVQEFLQPHFYLTWQSLPATVEHEPTFRESFQTFITPLQRRQHSADIFLKQRLDLANPRLTNAALHKYLKKDSQYLGFSISPKVLHQSYILSVLQRESSLSDQQLATKLMLDPQALQYYQHLLTDLS